MRSNTLRICIHVSETLSNGECVQVLMSGYIGTGTDYESTTPAPTEEDDPNQIWWTYHPNRSENPRECVEYHGPRDVLLLAHGKIAGQPVEAYLCVDTSQTWPGYHGSCPLGKTGVWVGTHRSHHLVESAEEFYDWCNLTGAKTHWMAELADLMRWPSADSHPGEKVDQHGGLDLANDGSDFIRIGVISEEYTNGYGWLRCRYLSD